MSASLAFAPPAWRNLWLALALASPGLLAMSFSPSSTALNQLLAVLGWGVVVGVWPWQGWQAGVWRRLLAPLLAVAWLLVGVGVSWAQGLPRSLALEALLMLLVAAVVLAWAAQAEDSAELVLAGLLLGGCVSGVIALIQVFAPQWADGELIARSGLVGRAVGNLRQPNHLSTLLLWGLMALVPLAQAGRVLGWRLPGALAASLGALMAMGVVLTASRTGVLGFALLALWGLLDRRLRAPVRWALIAAPLVYLLDWLVVAWWAEQTQHTFGGQARLNEADLSSSRFGIWANAWRLLLDQPWTGVGFGNFNFAWTLTPFPGRPVAFFDHTHNLPLQLAVELGLPLAGLILGLLLWGLWRGGRQAWTRSGESGPPARAALMIVLLAGVHSLLEYPLWYTYFLLPTAWGLGYLMRPDPHLPGAWAEGRTGGRWSHLARPWVAGLMVLGTFGAALDYGRVVVIYQPGDSPLSLSERIARGQRSPLYGHHADYAAATTTNPPAAAGPAFFNTAHSLLDTRLMIAWAQALAQVGETDKASYLAARLREFRNPAADEFFAACEQAELNPPPFQCRAPGQTLSWRDFQALRP